MIYTWLFALVLARIDPERVHTAVSWVLRRLNRIRPLRSLARKLLFPIDERLKVRAIGLEFPTPLGLAAGFDKDAKTYDAYATLGFGCVEVGTVTAAAQPGNAGKRIFRIRGQQAVVNRMGFPNEGAAAVAQRLSARRDRAAVLGVNVGRSKSTAAEAANDDYQQSVRTLAPFADYLALNVSSPNTPGLRDMQAVDVLENLIKAVREALADISRNLPVLVKISPDLADEEIDAIADLAMQLELDGIIATNTTVDTGCLSSVPPEVSGGISGAPLKPRANAILRRLYGRTAGAVTLISVGGIDTPEEAWNRIAAGASLIQAHTGFVYGGPLWPHRVNKLIAQRTRELGFQNVQQAIGCDARRVVERSRPERFATTNGSAEPAPAMSQGSEPSASAPLMQ